jgi:hypothetical protein
MHIKLSYTLNWFLYQNTAIYIHLLIINNFYADEKKILEGLLNNPEKLRSSSKELGK